ncbi:hypothetical protein KXD40_004976 [Peronospora effusa]|nr:hypothetical protein KXD40_004976 [Peronospora effusa]
MWLRPLAPKQFSRTLIGSCASNANENGHKAAIKQVENEASSSPAKHVDVRLKFIIDYYKKGAIKPTYVNTHDMLADMLTKSL